MVLLVSIENPSIPKKSVTLAVVSECVDKVENIELIKVGKNKNIFSPISNHPDVNLCYAGNNTVFVACEQTQLVSTLKNKGFNVIQIDEELHTEYPCDSLLNVAVFGNTAILNKNTASKKLQNYLCNNNFNIIEVKQGYSKCSVLPIAENAVITTDEIICKKLSESNIDCLKVSPNGIKLDGYDYGFIGGCGGMISENELYFFGDITTHIDYLRIADFLKKHNIFYKCGCGSLKDLGSFIPLKEKVKV